MKRLRPHFSLLVLVLAAALTLACGSSASRTLQSVAISPASADAKRLSRRYGPVHCDGYLRCAALACDSAGGDLGNV